MKRPIVLYMLALLAALLAGLAPAAATAAPGALEAASCTGDGVYLYDGKNYGGRCIKLTADDSDLSDEAFNNITSSIRIVGDWTATLFVDQGYGGSSSTFTRDDPDLSDDSIRDNRASSIRIYQGNVPSENRCDGDDGIYLYDGKDYTGRCIKLTADDPDLSDLAFNNITSSIKIIGDWTATLFVDQNYSGSSSTFTSDDSDLSNNSIGDNRASAVRVVKGNAPSGNSCDGGDGVYLYEHPNYQGRCVKFTGDAGDLRTLGFDDTASSIRILGIWTAILFRDLYGTGISSTFTQEDANLADNPIGDNQVTSVAVRRGNVPSGNACDGGEGVYLYEHPNYQGRCVKFTGDAGDLRTLGFDDTASSIRIRGNWTAVLFRDLYGTGISSTFTQDDANLADDGIGDNQATSVAVRRGNVSSGNACDGGEGVYLYEHPNYQGRCVKLTSDAGDLRTLGFDDIVSSVRIVGGWTTTLFRDLYGTGISSTYTQSSPNVAGDTIGDNQATSVSVRRR
jgi:Beta/Gamma crystallin